MRIFVPLLVLSALAWASDSRSATPQSLNLMPVPAKLQIGAGELQLDNSFNMGVAGHSDARLLRAIDRLKQRIAQRTGIQLPPAVLTGGATATLSVECREAGSEVPRLGEDESYFLEITPQHAALRAASVTGALRGMETLLQLITASPQGYSLPAVTIDDKPRFPWRGLMIDVSRHWEPVEVIKRNLDGLAAVKMNVFHWHLTDDQGFRIESKKFPKLTGMGSDGLFYTQEQVREVIAYAADRGIRVVPEFDMPGHSTSWAVGYPELASAPGSTYQIERRWGIFDPTLDPTRESTYKFLDTFLGEMAQLFPDQYLHIGGDENNGKQWSANPKIQQFMQVKGLKDTAALQAYFNQRLLKILSKHGKKMIGWDEVLVPALPKDIVVQSWRGTASLAVGARQGYSGILSAPYYYDHMETAAFHYLADPVPAGSDLTPEQAARILGGEACMWNEFVTPESIDSRIWPRNAALAERLWSPREVTDVADMYRRLAVISVELEQEGLLHLSSTGRMLRRAAGKRDIEPLQTIAKVAEPEGLGTREQMEHDTQLTPLVRMCDAVAPDPDFTRAFAALVRRLLNDSPQFLASTAELETIFQKWRDLPVGYQALAERAPLLQDVQPRVADLSHLGTTGAEALMYLHTGFAPSAEWKEQAFALVRQAEKPNHSMLRLPWLPYYRALVVAAANVEGLKNTTAQQWQQQIWDETARQEPKRKLTW